MDGLLLLQQRVPHLPTAPGVYRMLGEVDANGERRVLYVGKAKNLRARVTQYMQTERMGGRIRKMVFETRELVVVETRTEVEALLLEANLIKSLKPHYNILFRDDATYVSVVITGDGSLSQPLIASLPYQLTGGQEQVLADISADLSSGKRMVRLLQGDVGSGKTIVALMAMLKAVEQGLQCALMAPTELIARQHYEVISKLVAQIPSPLEGEGQGGGSIERIRIGTTPHPALPLKGGGLFYYRTNPSLRGGGF